jgi:predicted DNA-binding transcriptional regulator AlpA
MSITKLYLNEIEASERYCYSRSWFQRSRWAGNGPKFLKIGSKILYPLVETDEWFKQHGLRQSTSGKEK